MIAIAIVETLRATSRMGDMIGWFDPVGVVCLEADLLFRTSCDMRLRMFDPVGVALVTRGFLNDV